MTQFWQETDPRQRGQDANTMYSGTQLGMPHYQHGHHIDYINADGHAQYPDSASSFEHHYPPHYTAHHQRPGHYMFMSGPGSGTMSYSMQPPPLMLASQHRTMPHQQMFPSLSQHNRMTHQQSRLPSPPAICLADTEDQISPNSETLRSEPVTPELEGYPNVDDFDEIMKDYVANLSPKKQDKALIHAKRAANIKSVLLDRKQTSIESAQFRFWVKKMFSLQPLDGPPDKQKICHENKPVAIREKLFKILVRAHKACSHGGRDKTSTQVRRIYSWVPKELISRFVKLCPTCQVRRGTTRPSPPTSDHDSVHFMDPDSPQTRSTAQSHRYSTASTSSSHVHSPMQASNFSAVFHAQNRWMDMTQPDKPNDRINSLEAAASAMVSMNMTAPASPESYITAPPKFTDDPDTPYNPNAMQTDPMPPQYHHHGYSNGSRGDYYRTNRGPIFKQERY